MICSFSGNPFLFPFISSGSVAKSQLVHTTQLSVHLSSAEEEPYTLNKETKWSEVRGLHTIKNLIQSSSSFLPYLHMKDKVELNSRNKHLFSQKPNQNRSAY